ncbi:hypothetical protein Hypma_012248 [Hypsizygus marmoreus]|uniref:Ribonuclease H1 N-terminal domain-containing protein n=1 Tax=Hypsizygus marmoreus TaxID=39966 RepID=A0A369JFG0_HYPMA|nr:hypothetical protein Hypma_012248 [Hypsizygus marmoreus]
MSQTNNLALAQLAVTGGINSAPSSSPNAVANGPDVSPASPAMESTQTATATDTNSALAEGPLTTTDAPAAAYQAYQESSTVAAATDAANATDAAIVSASQGPTVVTAQTSVSISVGPSTAPIALQPPELSNVTTNATRSTGISPRDLAQQLAEIPAPANAYWYVVTMGREPGVYLEWHEVSPLVSGIPAVFIKCKTPGKSDALRAYIRAWDRGDVRRI